MTDSGEKLPNGCFEERLRDALDSARELVKRANDRLTLDRLTLAKRYVQGKLRIHVHIRRSSQPSGGAGEDYCTVFDGTKRRLVLPVHVVGRKSSAPGYVPEGIDSDVLAHGEGGDQEPVLVYIVGGIEHPQEIAQAIIPGFVWHNRAHHVHDGLLSGLYRSAMIGKSTFEFLGRVKDRKLLAVPPGVTPTGVGDVPPQDVEGGPQIVENLAGDGSEMERRLLAHTHAIKNGPEMPQFLVYLGDNDIRVLFKEGFDFGCEITDVLFGPFDLDPAAGGPLDGCHR
jgi:hypothetical protein